MSDEAIADPIPVSIIICCFNSANTLGDTLDAVARQEYDGWWEVLVMDNGSTDGTAGVAQRYHDVLPNLRVIAVTQPGQQARALNAGIAAAKTDALIFLDSDDEAAPGYVRHMAAALTTKPFVGAALELDKLNRPDVRHRRLHVQKDRIDHYCHFWPAVVGATMGARREVLEQVGGFDESLSTQHDLDVSWRLLLAGVPASFVPGAVLHYRYRPTVRATFRQEYFYGVGEAALFRRFHRHGMPRPSIVRIGLAWSRATWALLTVWRFGGPARLATRLGMNLGRIRGSLRSRTLYL